MTLEILQDYSSTGRERPWKRHKAMNELLQLAYEDVNKDKAARLAWCATHLKFGQGSSGGKRLKHANFCRVRLCPMCTWRRSLKVFGQMTKIMDAIKADKPMSYILLTLTVRNCLPHDLKSTIDGMNLAFNLLTKCKEYKDIAHGYYRAMEVKHNLQDDTYHPHYHVIIAVNPSYFTSRDYIKQARWGELWQRALKSDYVPRVDVRKVKGDTVGAVAEIAKYATKDEDYIIPDDWDMTVETVRLLDAVFNKRRFLGYGGIFREYHKKLNLDNAEDGDLIHVEADEPETEKNEKIINYVWYSGYRQYYRVEE